MSFSAPAYVSLFLPLAVTLSALLRRSPTYKPWHSLLGLAFLGLSGWQQPLVFVALVAGNVLAGRLPGRARRVAAVIWNVGAVALSRLSLPVALPQGISYAAFQALSWHLDDERSGTMDFAFYLLFFPKQPMGPLARYQELAVQKPDRAHIWDDAERGCPGLHGGCSKGFIADNWRRSQQRCTTARRPTAARASGAGAWCSAAAVHGLFGLYRHGVGRGACGGLRCENFRAAARR